MKILIFTSAYPPDHSIGARRWGLFSEELAKQHEVTVVKMSGVFSADPTACAPKGVKVKVVPYARAKWQRALFQRLKGGKNKETKLSDADTTGVSPQRAVSGRGKVKNRLAHLVERFRFLLTLPCTTWSWGRRAAELGVEAAEGSQFDIVIGSHPHVSCLRAARLVSEKLEIPWIADFRDPFAWYAHNPISEEGLIHRRLVAFEKRLIATASAVTAVNEELFQFLAVEKKRSFPLMNPAKRADHTRVANSVGKEGGRRAPQAVTLSYAGSLGERYLGSEFCEYVAAYHAQNLAKIRVSYCGSASWYVTELAQAYEVSSLLDDHGMLPNQDVQGFLQAADLLVLLSVRGRAVEFIETGKLIEYLFANKPILAVGNNRSHAMKRVIEETGTGWFVTNEVEFAAAIEAYQKGEIPIRNEEVIRRYEPAQAVKPLLELLETLVPK